MKRLLRICYAVMVIGLLVSTFAWGAPAVGNFIPSPLEPQLSSDGNTLYNGAQPVIIVDRPKPFGELSRIPPPFDLLGLAETATATFTITYIAAGGTDHWGESCVTFPESAKAAFNAAAAIWGNLIQSSVPITIKACWANLDSSSTLGYSGGGTLHKDFTGAPKTNTWYSASLANALSGSDRDSSNSDMHITYNSNFSWYYGTDGNPWFFQHDLITVVLHEIGHGLNFTGLASYSGGQGSLGSDGSFGIYDTFMKDGSGNPLTGYTSPSASLGSVLTGGNLWFHGSNAMAANGGGRVKMYAPATWNSGSSYSHLDYTTFNNTANQLMVYAISAGEAIHDPGTVTEGILKDLGWPSASDKSLITADGQTTVYWLQNNIIYHVIDADVLNTMQNAGIPGWSWSSIYNVHDLTPYTMGQEFISTSSSSNDLFIRLYGGNDVYLINNGIKEYVSFDACNQMDCWNDIIDVPQTILDMFSDATLSVSLTANPSSGYVPLNGVDLTATVSGSATGTINYTFYCNRSDSGTNITSPNSFKIDGRSENGTGGSVITWGNATGYSGGTTFTVYDVCNYLTSGTYTAKVIAERGSALSAEQRVNIVVAESTTTSISPTSTTTSTLPPTIPTTSSTTSTTSSTTSISSTTTSTILSTTSTTSSTTSSTTTTTIPGDDAYEENDTQLTAWPSTYYNWENTWLSNIDGSGIQSDQDWFAIDVAPGNERVQIDVRFSHATGDIDIALVDSDGGYLRYSTSSTDNEFIDYHVLPGGGQYYILIYSGIGGSDGFGNSYDLWWDDLPPSNPPWDDCFEENDTLQDAWYPGSNWEGIWTPNYCKAYQIDDDWYEIDISSGEERINIVCQFTHELGNIGIELYNSSGNMIASSDGVISAEYIDHTVPVGGGKYYIRVYGENTYNEYELMWNDSPPSTTTTTSSILTTSSTTTTLPPTIPTTSSTTSTTFPPTIPTTTTPTATTTISPTTTTPTSSTTTTTIPSVPCDTYPDYVRQVPAPEVPAEGPLTPEQIDDLPPPSEDTSAIDEQLKAEIARIEADADAKGLHLASPPVDKIEAGVAFRESLTDAQRQAVGKAFAQYENELEALMVPVKAVFKDKGQRPGAELLRSLEERIVTWQATLDSDIEKVLTKEQIDLYRWSQPTVPKLDVTASDLEALGLEVPEADEETESLADVCTDCYYTYYYGYYTYINQYYAYLYAYYGYSSTGSSDAYYAYLYNYYAYYYAEYVYIYGNYAYTYCPNSTYASYAYDYSNYALTYSYYGYLYSYYAYYYSGDSNLYYAYLYAYEGYSNSSAANISASNCNC